MNILNMPTAEQIDTQNTLLASIASNVGVEGISIKNWADVQRLVRMGLAHKFFSVGDQFVDEYNGEPILWDIIGINHDKPSDPKYSNSITLQAHNCIFNAQFSAPQAIASVEEDLVAGEHVLTTGDVQVKFTTSETIPAGGVIFIASRDGYTPLTFDTYAANRTTVVESGLSATVVEGEVDTVTNVNDRIRARYGSNNYEESAIRQFLNSNKVSFAWEPQTEFDMPPTGAPYSGGGFLSLLDPELVKVLGKVDKQVANNTVTDGGGQTVFSDKAFLLSRVEVYGGTEGTVTGEEAYDYYSLNNSEPVTGAADWRIKYLQGSPRHWWLRSPNVGSSSSARPVYSTGGVSNGYAVNADGFAPACTII